MSEKFRSILMVFMSFALFFGFMHLFLPGSGFVFERLHIFLFNLVSGGAVVLFYTEGRKTVSGKVKLYMAAAFCYAVLVFFRVYPPAIGLSIFMAVIVESVRIREFSIFPTDFFRKRIPVHRKFHQASLLCLSIGLVISTLVILNNEYFKLVSLPKLKLDTFFLGFSFPLSLITMSVMFSLMREDGRDITHLLKNVGFWFVNLGVIIFFLFILFEKMIAQVGVTTILFLTVIMIFHLFRKLGIDVQQKNFLLSGMFFLLITAITGILYIVMHLSSAYADQYAQARFLLKVHAFASLYGWNLSGLAVICRYDSFPMRLHSRAVVGFHWVIVMILAPLGLYFRSFSILAVICYTLFLFILFSTKSAVQPTAILEKKT